MSRDILFVAESLLPARGGAERFALELLGELAGRGNRVRALWLGGAQDAGAAAVRTLPAGVTGRELAAPPRDPERYWQAIAARTAVLTGAVGAAPGTDVLVAQLHGAPAALACPAPAVELLPSYESLCKVAHGPGATVLADRVEPVCPPPRDCRACPLALPGAAGPRRAQDAALRRARTLVACSRAVAAATRAWSGREDVVVAAGVARAPGHAAGKRDGHVLLAAGTWAAHKGRALLEPIVAGLAGRPAVVTAGGLDGEVRDRLETLGAVLRDGPIEDVLEGAAVCVVPSQWPEPFGRVAFEAQACGVPVVAPRTGGLPEHVASAGLVAADARAADYLAAVASLDEGSAWASASAAAREAAAAVVERAPLARAADAVEAAA